ncbi:hypothetical protein V3C99_002331 [Haemonchus contortus]
MACTFYREIPSFELRFACNFKGCLDDRPMSMMGAIEHQAFHFCEVYKTQAHFNFKCEYCNVYHVNKSHHRLCLDDKSGIGHLPHLRSIYTVPMSDQEFHSCVDFSRFANHHMIPMTAEGIRLVPADSNFPPPQAPYNFSSSLPGRGIDATPTYNNRNSNVSYRDLDNCDEHTTPDKFGRSGGFQDQSNNRENRGRGRGGSRGRGERGFGRGRGRGGGNRDNDNGRENNFRGRGRGRGGNHRDDGNNSYRARSSFGDSTPGTDWKPKRERSYSRSTSRSPCSPLAKKGNTGNKTQLRSYSRSRSNSPAKKPPRGSGPSGPVSRPCSYSRSRSSSPPSAAPGVQKSGKKPGTSCSYSRSRSSSPTNPTAESSENEGRKQMDPSPRSSASKNNPSTSVFASSSTAGGTRKRRSDRSYSRSGSRSPPNTTPTRNTPAEKVARRRSSKSYSRSGSRSRSPPPNDLNNNDPPNTRENRTYENGSRRSVYDTEPENYMNTGYGSGRQAMRGHHQSNSDRSFRQSNGNVIGLQKSTRASLEKKRDRMADSDYMGASQGDKRGAKPTPRDCSYSKSRSCSP